MTREERAARIDELRKWINEQNDEFRDESFPPEVQVAWDQNNAELREEERVTVELEQRDARIADLAKSDEGSETGADTGTVRRNVGPQLIARMSEREVFDMNAVRVNPFNPTGAAGEIRERALRANDLLHYAHPSVDQARAKGHVEALIRREGYDDDSYEAGAVAKRVLLTGSPDYRRAFGKLMSASMRGQIGMAALNGAELRAIEAVRALSTAGAGGGFAVPVTLDPTVVPTSNYSVNPFRQVCRTEQITGLVWNGVTVGAITAAYAAEAAVASDNAPTFAQPTLSMIRAQAFVPTSIEITQDWGGIQSEIARNISDAKDDLEATQFTTGAGGATAPTGLITGATTVVQTATAATFALGDLYLLEQGVPPRFRPRSVVMANRFILNKVRQFDTAGGSGVWFGPNANGYGGLGTGLENTALSQSGNVNASLLGYPVYEDTAMAAATTTNSLIVVMGDPRYYIIVDRIGMDIELIPHLFNTGTPGMPTGQRGFYAFWRNNANVLSASAFRVLKVT